LLLDNNPSDDYERDFKCLVPGLRYVKIDENLGFGRANNLGMQMATGKYILLLNSDTLLLNNAFYDCISFLESEAGRLTDVMGIKLLNEDGTYQQSFYPYLRYNFIHYCKSNNPFLYKIFKVGKDYREPSQIRGVGDISGAFILLRRKVFEKTGGFDPDFFLYYEETEWCRKRILKEFRITYYPFSSIIHYGGKSAPKGKMAIQAMISQGLFWYKLGILKFIAFIIFNLINYLIYCASYIFVSGRKKEALRWNLKVLDEAVPYWLFNIPKYSRRWGSRKTPLIYHKAREVFFSA
jgi:GT2 family glycosyltransferase